MFRLRECLVDPSLNRVISRGQTVQVEPKIMQVLVALADRPGEVVTRDDLMARVWPGVFVTDDVIHRAIRELRRLFGDDAEQPSVIETIRKRGYRHTAVLDEGIFAWQHKGYPVVAAPGMMNAPAPPLPLPR